MDYKNLENYVVNFKVSIREAIKKMDLGGLGFIVVLMKITLFREFLLMGILEEPY